MKAQFDTEWWPATTNYVEHVVLTTEYLGAATAGVNHPTNIWTNAFAETVTGQVVTGSVKDAWAYQIYSGLRERYHAAGEAYPAEYRPKFYIWQRDNAHNAKLAASNIVVHYADQHAAVTNDVFTNDIPTYTASSMTVRLSLPTNFWTYTPYTALNRSSNGWDSIYRVVTALVWTAETPGWRNDGANTNTALWGESGWLNRGIATDPTWTSATNYPTPYGYAFDDSGLALLGIGKWNNGYWLDYAPASTNYAWDAHAAFGYSTNYYLTLTTNFEKTVDLYFKAHCPSSSLAIFDSNGDGFTTNNARYATSNLTTAAGWNIGPLGDTNLALGTYTPEPSAATQTTTRGWMVTQAVGVVKWDASTNGFRYR